VPLLVGGRFLPARDVAVMQLPWRAVWRAQVRELTLPVWDPCSNGGRLMLANPNTMAAYPGTLLFAVFEPETASLIHVALHHLLFALGCWRLARRAGASPAAAALASAWASTCGIAWSALNLLNLQTALAWMPWLLAGAVDTRATRTTALKQGLWAGAIAGLAFLGGEPDATALGGGRRRCDWNDWHRGAGPRSHGARVERHRPRCPGSTTRGGGGRRPGATAVARAPPSQRARSALRRREQRLLGGGFVPLAATVSHDLRWPRAARLRGPGTSPTAVRDSPRARR
jgi:hypothetical protein